MITNNAIIYSQFQIRGGLKGAATAAVLYTIALVTTISIGHRADPRGFGNLSNWMTGLMVIQTAIFVLYAGSRIALGIRTDLNGKMIESHRLMPMSSAEAIWGYMLGGASHPALLLVANFLIGIGVCVKSGTSADRWFLGNAILAVFAMFLWTMLALLTFNAGGKGKGGIGWVFGIVIGGVSTGGLLLILFPAVSVLCSPIQGNSIYMISGGTMALSSTYALSLVGQVAIGSMCFLAAARKYESSQAPAFTPLMALVVLATWTGITVYAMLRWEEVQPAMFRGPRGDEREMIQVIASLLASMLLAILPVAAGSRAYRTWQIKKMLNDPGIGLRPMHPIVVTVAASALCVLICCGATQGANHLRNPPFLKQHGASDGANALILTSLIVLAFLFSMMYLLRILHRGARGRLGGFLLVLFVILAWAVPMLLDVARAISADEYHDEVVRTMSTFSPIGALINLWGQGKTDAALGVVGQVSLPFVLALLFHGTGRRRVAALR